MSREKQKQLEEINRPMNEELYNNIEKQYQEIAKVKTESEQIEEMAKVFYEAMLRAHPIDVANGKASTYYAAAFYNAGYRKQRVGEWTGESDGYADGEPVYDVWHCSECNHCIDDGTDDADLLPNYCPNCGSKMKGGAEQ